MRPIPVADAGLQPERTALAWTRTALAMIIASMTLMRWSVDYPETVMVAIVALLVLGLGIIGVNRSTYRRQANALSRSEAQPNTATVALSTLMMLLLGSIGLSLIL